MKNPTRNGLLWSLVNILLAGLAVALGADGAFAMSEVVISDDTVADRKVADSKGDETQMPGSSATRGDELESGFAEDEIDDAIAEFQAYKTPAGYLIHELASKKTVSDMEVTHYRTSTPVFEIPVLNTKTASTTTSDQEITLIPGTDIDIKLARYLYEWKNVYAIGSIGYEQKGEDWVPGILALQVVENVAKTRVVLRVLNPKTGTASSILAGSTLLIGAIAASESQMVVAPDNFEPVSEKFYLQKRIFNVMFTDEFVNGKNKVAFGEEDIRRGALYSYKVNNEITDLLGYPSKAKVEVGNNMTPEYVYTTKGVLRQLNMLYTYDSSVGIQPTDFTAISLMMFTRFSENDNVTALCGSEFIAGVLNMDLTVHKEIRFEDVTVGGLTMRGWKNNFGTISLIYLPIFDLLQFKKCALLVDWKNATCYMKRSGKTFRVDMKKGVGDNREATRDVYSQIYGVALKGYNSLFVCPADEVPSIGLTLPNLVNSATTYGDGDGETSLPGSATTGDVLYLTKAMDNFKAGDLVVYNGTSWTYYVGVVAQV